MDAVEVAVLIDRPDAQGNKQLGMVVEGPAALVDLFHLHFCEFVQKFQAEQVFEAVTTSAAAGKVM